MHSVSYLVTERGRRVRAALPCYYRTVRGGNLAEEVVWVKVRGHGGRSGEGAFLVFGGSAEGLSFAVGEALEALLVDFLEDAVDLGLEGGGGLLLAAAGGGVLVVAGAIEVGAGHDPDEAGGHTAEVAEVTAGVVPAGDHVEDEVDGI